MIVKDDPLLDPVLNAIIKVESGGNPLAFNQKEEAYGLLQIRPIMIREVNRILRLQKKNTRYSIADAMDSVKSIQIYYIIQSWHSPDNDPYRATVIWNGKSRNDKYWKKVEKILNQ